MLNYLFPDKLIAVNSPKTLSDDDPRTLMAVTQQHGFIRHPINYPLKLIPLRRKNPHDGLKESGIGIMVNLEKKQPLGSEFMLTLTLANEEYAYETKLIFLKQLKIGYEAGLWLYSQQDSAQVRIIEQICHIENYLWIKKQIKGIEVNPNNAAAEWINTYSEGFPQFQ